MAREYSLEQTRNTPYNSLRSFTGQVGINFLQ